jgi:hypothetical protein
VFNHEQYMGIQVDKLWLIIGGHATWCKANDLSSCSNELFQPVIPMRLALLVQAVQVKGASTWVPNVPTAILQVFFFLWWTGRRLVEDTLHGPPFSKCQGTLQLLLSRLGAKGGWTVRSKVG